MRIKNNSRKLTGIQATINKRIIIILKYQFLKYELILSSQHLHEVYSSTVSVLQG